MPEKSDQPEELIRCEKCGLEYRERETPDGYCPRCLLQGTLSLHTLRVDCPHCHQSIEVEDEPSTGVFCRACGSAFRLDLAEAASLLSRPVTHIGRFELRERVGDGSFGTVWRAHDPRLNRAVALKIPRQGRFANDEEETRFLREGRVAAQLRHPGIVTIHEVDRADGQPFIVSEFVQGVTLEKWLKRQPAAFRQAAEWTAQIAEVLDYSHGMGVIHRDLKPSNIILDAQGPAGKTAPGPPALTPRLMDFGIAKHETTETIVTLDGQIVGTPAYMSPEQIRTSHDVDGRADIYSLGVILYELLTAELPFRGTAPMIMQQVLHEEPRAPRRLNDRIPRDLETIALKCLEKAPARRYARARDLAEDLRRWLADEPIRARPIGSLEKIDRWRRRRPAVAVLSAALGLALAAGFAGVLWQWWRAEDGLREAERQRFRAEANYRQARQTVDEFLGDVERKLGDVPGLQPLHRDLMERALKYYRGFARDNPDIPAMQLDLARTFHRIGVIIRDTGAGDEALQAFDRAIALYEKAQRAGPSGAGIEPDLAMVYQDLGTLNASLGRSKEAWNAYQKAREHYDRLKRREQSLNSRVNAAHLHNGMGLMKCDLRQSTAAIEHHRRAQKEYEDLLREWPDNAHIQCGLGFTLTSMSRALMFSGKYEEALQEVRRGIPRIHQAVARIPNEMTWRRRLANSYFNLGGILMATGRTGEALAATNQALDIQGRLADENPSVAQFGELKAAIQVQAGVLKHRVGRSREALDDIQQAIATQEKCIRKNPFPVLQRALARSYLEKSRLLFETGRLAEVPPLGRKLRELLETVLGQYPEQVECRQLLGNGWVLDGDVFLKNGDPENARAAFERAAGYFKTCCEASGDIPDFRRDLAAVMEKLSRTAETLRKIR